jgi:rubrerythrin
MDAPKRSKEMNAENTVEKLIDFAIDNEIKAFELYSGMSQKVDSPAAKKMLDELAKEEAGHKSQLEAYKGTHLDKFDFQKVQDLKLSDHLVASEPKENSSIQDLFVFAMKKEKEAADLYDGLSQATDDAETKTVFEKLRAFEMGHKNKLERLYDEEYLQEN